MQSIAVTDLHGNLRLYELLFRIAETWKISSVFITGDLAPTMATSRDVGWEDEEDAALIQREFLKKQLAPLVGAFLARHRHTHVYAIMGNDDRRVNEPILTELDEDVPNFHVVDDRLIVLHESKQIRSFFAKSVPLLYVAGYPYVPPGSGLLMDWVKYENDVRLAPINMDPCMNIYDVGVLSVESPPSTTIADDLEDFGSYLDRCGRSEQVDYDPTITIHLFHAPPYDTALDWISPQGGYALLPLPNHIGSTEIRRFIERRHPYVALCGHCHEAPVYGNYRMQIGDTWCVNPGSQAATNVLSVVQFDVFQPANMKQFYINAE